jgi:hypothetical protein
MTNVFQTNGCLTATLSRCVAEFLTGDSATIFSAAMFSAAKPDEGLIRHQSLRSAGVSSDGFGALRPIRRKDLTAMWMLAKPPSAFLSLVSRLELGDQSFNLSWLCLGKSPPASGTLLEIPEDSHVGYTPHPISSPRSVLVMLRNGLTLRDLTPQPLGSFYRSGALRGLPPFATEIHFASSEANRRKKLSKVRRDYESLCALISREDLVAQLQLANPEVFREVLISREEENVQSRGGSPLGNETGSQSDDDGEAAKRRLERSAMRQQKALDKYMCQLESNARILRENVEAAKHRDDELRRKETILEEKRRREAESRRERQQKKQERLEKARRDAYLKEELRKQELLNRLHRQEEYARIRAQEQHEQKLVSQEEHRIQVERKFELVMRREKQRNYENLITIDRIRRKVGRVRALEEIKAAALQRLKQQREQASLEMVEKTNKFAVELLEFQRKCGLK